MRPQAEELKPLIRLAAPIAFSHMANYFMQIVDTFFVGRLGAVALGGTALGSGLFAIVMMVAVGILLGLDYRVSHAFGAKRYDECQRYLVQGFYLAILLAVPMTIFFLVFANHVSWFGSSSDINAQAGEYLKTLSWSLLPFLLFTACRQYLQATGTAGPILIIFLGANLINAFFNWVFIWGHLGSPALGVAGSGISTSIARVMMLIAIFVCMLRHNKKLGFSLRKAGFQFHAALVRGLLALGVPAAGQLLLEVGVFVTSTFMIGRIGAVPLAAHQIVLQIASFTFMMPLGISAAAAVVVGQALGARETQRAVKLGWSSIAFGGAVMAVFGLTMFAFSNELLLAFTNDRSVIGIARQLLLMAAFFQIFDGIQVVTTGALRGAGNTHASLLANLVGHWVFGLPIGLFLCFWMHWNAMGIWTGLTIGLSVVALILAFVWKRLSPSLKSAPMSSAAISSSSVSA